MRLTVLVAGLPEGLPLWEDNGYSQVLEGGDVEEGGVLVVPDVFKVMRRCDIVRKTGTGNVTGAAKEERDVNTRN